MRPRRKRISLDQLSLITLDDKGSVDSGEPGNQAFFANHPPPCVPSHSSSVTWKSRAIKDKEEYERIKQRVRHVAPEQFKAQAKPGKEPSEIFPQNVAEWLTHKKDKLAMAEAENQKNCALLKAEIEARQKIPKHQRQVKSAFGKGGKVFDDGLGPVLALPTIWSAEYGRPPAKWPGTMDMQWNGDSRQNVLAKTKCGRFLPPPSAPADSSTPANGQSFLRALPLDETGPIFSMGPRPDEVKMHNADADADPDFETTGGFWLGTALVQEIGEWRPVFVPDWQKARLIQEQQSANESDCTKEAMAHGAGLVVSPAWAAGLWVDRSLPFHPWGAYQTGWQEM